MERRYGVVHPQRTAAGYRLYDDVAIARLAAMRGLIAEGWSASRAAAAVLAMSDEAVGARREQTVRSSFPNGSPADDLVAQFVAAAAAMDVAAIEHALDQTFARGSFERVAEAYLSPMMVAVGEAWHAGGLEIAAEHTASHALLRRLAAAFEAAGRPLTGDRPVLVGLPPGGRHELGALAFAVSARRAGLSVIYLGPDLPAADWADATRATDARAAVIGAVSRADLKAAEHVAGTLRDAVPGLVVAVGGHLTEASLPDGVIGLPEGLLAGVESLRAALDRSSAQGPG